MGSIFGSITVLNKQPRIKKIGGIVIDGFLEEVHNRKSTITRLPVEDGSDISDHIHNEPVGVTVEGIISNTPMLKTLLAGGGLGSLFGDRVTQVFEELELLREKKLTFEVSTSLKIYTDMFMESFSPVKNSTTGQAMTFRMNFVKITKVTNQTVEIPNSIIGGDLEADQLQAQNNVSQGQTVGQANPTVGSNITTILADVAAQLGG